MPKSIRVLIAIIVLLVIVVILLADSVIAQKDIYDVVVPDRMEATEESNNTEDTIHLVELRAADILDSELYWLARGMEEEDGVSWTDSDILKIGTVIANRKDSPYYPNTYKEVLLDPGQYAPFDHGYTLRKPNDHYIYLAMKIMEGYRSFDSDVVFQALFVQGNEVVDSVYDYTLGSTTYFCK